MMAGQPARFEHGGDVYAHPGVIDFSSNLNPLGMPEAVVRALRDGAPRFDAYPDPLCRDLRARLAAVHGVAAEQIVCTAGAGDAIFRICAALLAGHGQEPARRALVTAPCFSGYEQAIEQQGAKVVRHRLPAAGDFAVTARVAGAIDGGIRLVFLCSPNNPTGLLLAPGALKVVLAQARRVGAYVVLDECFLPFSDAPSAIPLCAQDPRLIVVRAFTKSYAMAGLRLGYAVCSDAALIERLQHMGDPWAVSAPAQAAGMAALSVEGWQERTCAYVGAARERLRVGLEGLGLRVVAGQANFLLFQARPGLYDALLAEGFLIRRCGNYVGLDGSWYRVAVRREEENALLVGAMGRVLA